MKSLSEIHLKRGRSFAELYESVTANIRDYQPDKTSSPLIVQHPIVEYWIDGFTAKHNQWLVNEKEYLCELYGYFPPRRPRNFEPLFTLCALAALHVAYDLPITLAESFADTRFADYTRNACSLNDLKAVFNRMETPLTAAIKSKWKKPRLAALMLSWKQARMELVFMLWLVRLRNRAWDNGVTLFCKSKGVNNLERPLDELKLSAIKSLIEAKGESKVFFYRRILALGLVTAVFVMMVAFPMQTLNKISSDNHTFLIQAFFIVIAIIIAIYFYARWVKSSRQEIFKYFETSMTDEKSEYGNYENW